MSETRVFGRLIRSTETETYNLEESLTLGKETPLETVFSHTVSEREVTTTLPLTPAFNNSTSAFAETYTIENSLLSAGLSHNDNGANLAGNPVFETHSTKLSLGLADEAEVSISFSDLSLAGERVIEAVTVQYPGLEGEQSTLPLPVSTNLLVPLALGTAEGFVNNPDPSALLDTLTELAALPEPIGSVTGGGLPEGFTSLPALA